MFKTLAIPRHRTVTPIGMDVGLTGVRAAQLRQVRGQWSLTRAVHWQLRRADDQQQGVSAVEDRLRRAFRHNEFSGRTLVFGLSQPDVELHALELPEQGSGLGESQIESAARWEIERLGRFEQGTTETAHWRLPPGRGTRTTAFGVAAPKELLGEIWGLCQTVRGDCGRIDAAACALSRAGVLLRPPQSDEVWGILDLGARAVRLVLCVDGVPVLARSIEGGGMAWTESVALTLQVSTDSAELHKCDHGIRPPGSIAGAGPVESSEAGSEAGPLAMVGEMVFSALGGELERIAGEIERSYEYVLQCYPGRRAADLILVGGGAALKNLDTWLARRLGIPVTAADAYLERPEARITVAPTLSRSGPAASRRRMVAAYFCAIGLAVPLGGES
ncbi:MAG TPA: hypothetical protein VM243_13320 [Phycisphaerae bacterium]|nr:hypothetical protein [Phycisphaerae bacterium]